MQLTTRGSGYLGEVSTLSGSPSNSTVTITGLASGFANGQIVNSDIYFTSGTQSGKGGTITAYNHETTHTTPHYLGLTSGDGYHRTKVVILVMVMQMSEL